MEPVINPLSSAGLLVSIAGYGWLCFRVLARYRDWLRRRRRDARPAARLRVPIVALALLTWSLDIASYPLFLAGTVISGIAIGAAFSGGLATALAGRIVGEALEDDERSNRVVDRFLADLETLEKAITRYEKEVRGRKLDPSVLATAEAARYADAAGVARLRTLLADQGVATDPLERMRHAADLHRSLALLGRNGRLSTSLERCFDETARAHHVLGGLNAHMESDVELDEHARIVEAVESGDAEAAREAMRTHLRTIRRVTLRQWTDGPGLWD